MVILLLWYCCCGWRRYCCFDGVVFRTIDIDQSVSSICFVVAILSTNKHVSKQTTKQFYHSPFQLCACDSILSSSQALLPFHVFFFYVSSIMFLHSITLFVRTGPFSVIDVRAIIRTQDHSCCCIYFERAFDRIRARLAAAFFRTRARLAAASFSNATDFLI